MKEIFNSGSDKAKAPLCIATLTLTDMARGTATWGSGRPTCDTGWACSHTVLAGKY